MIENNYINETWKPVTIFPFSDNYEVSSHGRVRHSKTLEIRATSFNAQGYLQLSLYFGHSRNGNTKCFRVHTLVALAFIGEQPTPKHEVNHKDGFKPNNHFGNLEWTTSKGNKEHAKAMGLNYTRNHSGRVRHPEIWEHIKGSNHHQSKLVESQVVVIKQMIASGLGDTAIGKQFGVHKATIWSIRTGKTWTHILA